MVQAPKKPLTLEAFLALPETKPASEYVDGRVSQKPMPQGKHGRLQSKFVALLNAAIEPKKVAVAITELRCTFGGHSIIPDIAVFKREHIPVDEEGDIKNVFTRAPDWIIEILSPGQSSAKVIKKILRCLKNDTQMGWLIDPEDKAVFVYCPQQEVVVLDEPDSNIPVPEFANELITIRVEDLFALLKI